MALWPESLYLDYVAYPLTDVRADVQIHHGREDLYGEPAASTCQVVLLDVTHEFAQAFRVGGLLTVSVAGDGIESFPRFTGRITDAALDGDALTIIAVGVLAQLGEHEIGLVAWPQETWGDRLWRIFDEPGLTRLLYIEPLPERLFNPVLAARDPYAAGPTTLADALAAMAAMVGAAVTDLPDGRVLVQPIGERDFSTVTVPGHTGDLDPADVAYTPVWSQTLPVANAVTVTYTPGATLPVRTGVLTDESPIVTGLSSTADILQGMAVSGMGIPQDARVAAVNSASQITLTRAANIVANKDGTIAPGETQIDALSDTSDLSVGMTVEKAGDIQPGTKITSIGQHEVDISLPAVGTHVGNFLFTAPAACSLTFNVETAYVTVKDEASIGRFGERSITIDTTFVDVDDATRRASERLARASTPQWSIPAAPLLRGYELRVGYPVTLTGMPPASPHTDWLAVLEGWSETITGDDWTMELSLSDPALSGYVFTWSDIPAEWAWNELDPDASWTDALSLEGITP